MKIFFREHFDKILIIFAGIFLTVILMFYIWGARFLVLSFNESTELKSFDGEAAHFNIEKASQLNLGL